MMHALLPLWLSPVYDGFQSQILFSAVHNIKAGPQVLNDSFIVANSKRPFAKLGNGCAVISGVAVSHDGLF